MRYISFILVIVLTLGAAAPTAAQSGELSEQFTGAGLTVWYPAGWQAGPNEAGAQLILTNRGTASTGDMFITEPGLVSVSVASLETARASGLPTSNPEFLAGMYVGTMMMTHVFTSAFRAPSTEPVDYVVSNLEREEVDGRVMYWSEIAISGAPPVDMLVIVVGENLVLTATTSGGELPQWKNLLFEIAARAESTDEVSIGATGTSEAGAGSAAAATDTTKGTRSNPYQPGEWASFSEGKVRVLPVNTDFRADFYTPPAGARYIAIPIEWECYQEREDVMCDRPLWPHYISPDGLVSPPAPVYVSPLFWSADTVGYSGALLAGNAYFEVPEGSQLGLLRLELDGQHVFFELVPAGEIDSEAVG